MSKITDLKNLIKLSIDSNDLKVLETILNNEENLEQLQNYKYFDVYVYAIKSNQLHLIKYFYSKGFAINCQFSSNKRKYKENADDKEDCEVTGYSNALIEAIKCWNIDAVKILIEFNVNFNSTDYKHVPLQIAYNLYQKCKSNGESKSKLKVSKRKKLVVFLAFFYANY